MALVLQLIVVIYNHYSGYHELQNFTEFAIRLIRGTIYSIIAGFAIAYPDIFVIRFLNKKIKWNKGVLKRAIIQFSIMLLIAFTVSIIITSFAHLLGNYPQGFRNVLFNNILIYCVVNAFFMSILEAWIYLNDSEKEKINAEKFYQNLIIEQANREMFEAQIKMEEEKNKYAQELIDREKKLNKHLEEEIEKREIITKQLNESKEQLNSILANLAGAAFRCYLDEHYTMQYISEKIFDITGYHASEFIENNKLSFLSIIHPDDREFCKNNILEAIINQKHYEFEYRLMHKDGQEVWVNENGKGILNQEKEIKFLDGIIIDITRRKLAETQAKESERKYKDLLNLLPQPVFELDLNGDVLLSNKAGDEFFGPLSNSPNQKQSAIDCFIPKDRARIIENFKKSSQGIDTDPGEFTAIKSDGTLCPVMVFGNPIIENGEIVGRRGIIVDISERKKQELKLLHAKEELERMNNTLEKSVADRTRQLTEANTQLLKVQKENLQSQFEVLKQQVNPHFLFNSLNVLTSLIKIDPDLAESFTERLSKVYRYVLENKEKDLVSLSTELEFLNAYLFLLEIRFMEKLLIEIKIDKSYYDYQILPIAIQLIIENAIKHNTFSKIHPLKIQIFVDENMRLNIINNLNLRETKFVSTGVGLENIKRRYALVSDKKSDFIKTKDHFIAKLPLIKSE
ncbi:MAG: PAS domain S-box protein [Bacteroidales bacterium]|nr:PAS domain S-box protein [Bacteroidales bacterium]